MNVSTHQPALKERFLRFVRACRKWPPCRGRGSEQLTIPSLLTPSIFHSGILPKNKRKGYPLWYSWASLVAQLVENLPAMQETWVRSLVQKDPLEKERLPTPVFWPREFHGL